MTAEQSHRFASPARTPTVTPAPCMLWREVDLVDGAVVRQVVLTIDATVRTATTLTLEQAVEVAAAMLAAAR